MRRMLVCASLAGLLAGCAAIPTSGPVREGPPIAGDPSGQVIRVIARPPSAGMTPTQIVRGFLDASASFEGDHSVARQYLTPLASRTWDPAAGVRIYDLVPDVASSGASAVEVTAAVSATISADGALQVSPAIKATTIGFRLEQIEGQWRISGLPSGLLLSRNDIDRSFRSYNVYFFNPAFDMLVPDPRMLPVVGGTAATTLMRALLEGPSEWLAPAVTTGFPDGSTLALDAVTIDGGVARVDLDAGALLTDDATRRAMSAQIVWTLKQVGGVASVDVRAGGQPLPVAGVLSPQPRDAWPEFDPDAPPVPGDGIAIVAGAPVALTEIGTTTLDGWPGEDLQSSAVALSTISTRVAALDETGTLWIGLRSSGVPMRQVLEVAGLSRPAFDRSDTLWTVTPDGTVRAIVPDSAPVEVPVEGLARGTTVQSIIPAADGTRAALVVQRGARRLLVLARITSREGLPTLSGLRRIESAFSQVVDVSWQTATELAVLGSSGAQAPSAALIDLDRGSVRTLGGPTEPVGIAAAPGRPILVSTATSRIWAYSGGEWTAGPLATRPVYAS